MSAATSARTDHVTFTKQLEAEVSTMREELGTVHDLYKHHVETSIAEGEKMLETCRRELEVFDRAHAQSEHEANERYRAALADKARADAVVDAIVGSAGIDADDEQIASALSRSSVAGIRIACALRGSEIAAQARHASLSTIKVRKLADAHKRGRELAARAAEFMANDYGGSTNLFAVAPGAELASFLCATREALEALAARLERDLAFAHSPKGAAQIVALARREKQPTDEDALGPWRKMQRGAERLRALCAHSVAAVTAQQGAAAISQLTAKLNEATSS